MANGIPAHDAFAERVVVSAGILDPGSIPELSRFVDPEDFYQPPCREIWRAVVHLDEAGLDVGLESVASRLNETGKLQGIGGLQAIGEIVDVTPAMAAAHEYARAVAEKAAVRRAGAVCSHLVAEAGGTVESPREWLTEAVARLAEVTDLGRMSERDPAATAREVAKEVHTGILDRVARAKAGSDGAPGIGTGFQGLDYRIGRLTPGSLTILGAPTGIGKTGLALCIARNVARAGHGVAYATLEIPREELLERALADLTKVPVDNLFSGRIKDTDHEIIARGVARLAELPLVVDDATNHSLATLRGLVRRAERKLSASVGLLVVDYMQLVRAQTRRGATEADMVAEVSRGLLALAKDLNISVLALSQFNRDVKNRTDKEPQVTDLRQSGQIEQDARAIVLLQRTTQEGEDPQNVSAFTRKARGGGHVGVTKFVFRRTTSTWTECEEDAQPLGYGGRWSPVDDRDDYGIDNGF